MMRIAMEAWLFGMEWYFKILDYIENEKAQISLFNLSGRALIWWDNLMLVKVISERRIDYSHFQTYFS